MATGTTSGFLTWFNQWGQVIIYSGQMVYWIALAVAAIIAALQFKRLVTFKTLGGTVANDAEIEDTDTETLAE